MLIFVAILKTNKIQTNLTHFVFFYFSLTQLATNLGRTPVPLKRWAWLAASAPLRCFSLASSHHVLSITEAGSPSSMPTPLTALVRM